MQQTSNIADTHALVAAIGMGKNLKVDLPGPGGPPVRPSAPPMAVSPGGVGPFKSQIKTNIKSAHPYAR